MREDWIEVELGEVCEIYPGIGFPKTIQGKKEGKYPFFKVGDISKNVQAGNRKLLFCDNYIDDGDIKNIKSNILPANTVVFAKIGEALKLNRRCITSVDCLIDNNVIGIKTRRYTDNIFLYFFTLTIKLENYSRATTVPSVRKTDIEEICFPLAPLPIQRAIVLKIENLFASLDKGIADLKTAQEQLKVYRQAVLKKAFEGEFTNKNVKEGELPEGWKWVKLGEVATKIGSGSTPQGGQENYKSVGIPLIRSMNIHFDFIKYEGLAYIDEQQAKKLDNVTVFEDDILLNITGASIGRVNIAPKQWNNARVNQHVSIIRLKKESYNSKFIKYFIQAPNIQEWITNENYGATRQALSKSMIENILIPEIPLTEQHAIVREIESRLSVCDKVEQSISEALEKAEALRQSILKKAFEGKLLSEAEIAKCKQEADYEPAAKLLERIKKDNRKKY